MYRFDVPGNDQHPVTVGLLSSGSNQQAELEVNRLPWNLVTDRMRGGYEFFLLFLDVFGEFIKGFKSFIMGFSRSKYVFLLKKNVV